MVKIGKVNEAGDVILDEDSKVLEVTATDKTGAREDGLVCLGESELGSIYVNEDGEVLNEAVINHYFPYRDKKTGAVVLAGEVNDEGEVEFWTTDNDFDSMPVDDFLKKFKKGTIKDLDLFDDVGEEDDIEETEGLDLKKTSVNGKMVTLWINGKKYSYEPTNGMSAKEMAAKFTAIAKHSQGKALAWVKKNAKTNDSYKKSKASESKEDDKEDD